MPKISESPSDNKRRHLDLFRLRKFLNLSKFPSRKQWPQFFKILNRKERIVFFVFLFLFLSSSLSLLINFYFKTTKLAPSEGGIYIEGVIGFPRFINPLYAASSDVDRDLTELIFAGLMKYDENGKIVPDLAKEYRISKDGKLYEIYLKESLLWQDGSPLTADDIIFTIKTIQNPSFKSPLRASWLGVKVEKISDLAVSFELSSPSAVFLENLTLKILPQRVWQEISIENFLLSIYNLKPIGSGPYKFKNLTQNKEGYIQSLELVINPYYQGQRPNIPKITFYFFKNEDDLIKAFNSRKVKGFSLLSPTKFQNVKNKEFIEYHFFLPRYFAVFFNQEKSKILDDEKVRKALNYGTNKSEMIKEALLEKGRTVDSPVLPEIYGLALPEKIYEFNQEKAKELLKEAGFAETENGSFAKTIKKTPSFQFKSNLKLGSRGTEVRELQKCLAKDGAIYPEGEITGYFGEKTKTAVIKFQEKYSKDILGPAGLKSGTGEVLKSTREKLNELCAASPEEKLPLSFSLTTVDQPILTKVASILKKQWQQLGVKVEIKTFNIANLEQEVIRPRNYEMLLFGEVLGTLPDPFPFWHSSQTKDPGLNLTGNDNKKYDKLLEQARRTLNEEERKTNLAKFQNLLIEDSPAVFLYNPDYLYLVSKEIKGIKTAMITDPSKRFSNIEEWHIKTKRVWK